MPGIFGGIFSAIAFASYNSDPITDPNVIQYLSAYPNPTTGLNQFGRTLFGQGGCQIAATFISLGIGIIAGAIAGLIIRLFYSYQSSEFFSDSIHFQNVP
jgi:hypothetical protein